MLRRADMPHVKCSMFSSSCNYPIVMITQKITQLGDTRAFHLKNVTFLKSNQSEMIFSARLFFLWRTSFLPNTVNYERRREKTEKFLILQRHLLWHL